MADSWIGDLLGEISVAVLAGGHRTERADLVEPKAFGGAQKLLLAATAIAGYALTRYVGTVLGIPAIPGVSSLLLQNQPFYAIPAVAIGLIALVLLARAVIGTVRPDAPLFCGVLGLLALPTHGGDARNALLDAGGAGVYVTMAVEQILLAVALFGGYIAMVYRPAPSATPTPEADATEPIDSAADRAAAVGLQTLVTLALLVLLGQTPLKGQALLGTAAAAGLAAFTAQRTRQVSGSVWYVAGTMLAGFIAYVYTYFRPDGVAIGDVGGLLAGAARSLPLHYATAGVAGAIYGYWLGIDLQAERDAA